MSERVVRDFDVIQKIYNGDVIYCDKKPVNKKVDKLYSEIAELCENNDDKLVEELTNKYTQLISLLEIESFAKGIAFSEELMTDIKKVCI